MNKSINMQFHCYMIIKLLTMNDSTKCMLKCKSEKNQ